MAASGEPEHLEWMACGLESVATAIANGEYGSWVPSAAEQARLEQIFPDGVCDWSQGDVGRP